MLSKSLKALVGRSGKSGRRVMAAGVGCLLGLAFPCLAWLLGSMVHIAIHAQGAASEGEAKLGQLMPVAGRLSNDAWSPFSQVTWLLVGCLAIVLLASLLLFGFYRGIQRAAVDFEVKLLLAIREHARRLAVARTLSAQQTALLDSANYHLPRVRGCLSRWWRNVPRHPVQLIACVLLAGLLAPSLMLLAVVAIGLLTALYLMLDRIRRTALPVVRERAAQHRETLVSVTLNGPRLESVHASEELEQRFDDQMHKYERDAVRSLSSSVWKVPGLLAVGGVLTSGMLFAAMVQIFQADQIFTVAGLFTFILSLCGAGYSALRLYRNHRDLKSVEAAAEALERFLAIPVTELHAGDKQQLPRISRAELEHVTLEDSSGHRLLEDVSALFEPNRLIGIVASQGIQAFALAELLIGYGRPHSGRLLVDGVSIADVHPESLMRCAHWVSSDGAIITGTVAENIRGHESRLDSSLLEIVKQVRLSETIQRLPDGANTLITPDDDRLSGDDAFRIGLARVAVRKPSIAVIEEPSRRFQIDGEEETVAAVRSLVGPDLISVILPQRLHTLRQCDIVILLHEHRVAGVGPHAELLQNNELYRHVNYLRFNPFNAGYSRG